MGMKNGMKRFLKQDPISEKGVKTSLEISGKF